MYFCCNAVVCWLFPTRERKRNGYDNGCSKTIDKELSANVIVNAQVEAPSMDIVKNVGVWEAGYITYDKELAKATLLNNTEITKEENSPDPFVSDQLLVNYETENNSILGVGASILSYHTRFSEYVSNVFKNDPSTSTYNANLYKEQDFSFASRKQAEETVRGELRKLGIENLGTTTIYCLDYQTMQQQEELAKKDEDTQYFAQMGKVFFKDSWAAETTAIIWYLAAWWVVFLFFQQMVKEQIPIQCILTMWRFCTQPKECSKLKRLAYISR